MTTKMVPRRFGKGLVAVLLLAGSLTGVGAGTGTAFATSAATLTPAVVACHNDPGLSAGNDPNHCPSLRGKPYDDADIQHRKGHGRCRQHACRSTTN